ncbi:ribosomal protein L1 [Microthyrium microscopicum]|uniref:Ribosomal protein L1 n=1 Tax=Microthyrium microscopicum TaxID=703497 RepID=A0A6A6U2U5_9PEZI|nr:ribosomal protein L1 [Microthyrium microscopicum]
MSSQIQPLESKQTLKAALALVRHLEKQQNEENIHRPSLLADTDDESPKSSLDVPLWLLVTAKKHLATSHSLNPAKVLVPHPLYTSPSTRVCLITADPHSSQPKVYKKLIKDAAFPNDLQEKIVKVIAYSRLAKKFKQFEARRQLMADYDVFLVDERVAHLLPVALGKTFYKSTTKRPMPVSLTGKELWGKKVKKAPLDRLKKKDKDTPKVIGKPEDVALDIEKVLSSLAMNLSPSPTLSIKVAYAGWPAEWIAENVDVAVQRVVSKYVPEQWNGLKALHLKGPDTAALPIWMADQLWQTEDDVLDDAEEATGLTVAKQTKDEKKQRKELAKAKYAELTQSTQEEPKPEKKRKRVSGKDEEEVKVKKTKKKVKIATAAEIEVTGTTGKPRKTADAGYDTEKTEEIIVVKRKQKIRAAEKQDKLEKPKAKEVPEPENVDRPAKSSKKEKRSKPAKEAKKSEQVAPEETKARM